ncbi:MAG TPA: hypothetical protein VMI06_16115 [Terriglobia bacterium]|nr:hypothetical protein [Terriglobia bacterium]
MRPKCELAPEIRPESRRVLANCEGLGHVHQCACGAIHLVLGAVSLSFSRQSFIQAAQLMMSAARRLEEPPAARGSIRREGPPGGSETIH